MAQTEAKKKYDAKWQKEHYDMIHVRVPKGSKMIYQEAASMVGESFNKFINMAINERFERVLK